MDLFLQKTTGSKIFTFAFSLDCNLHHSTSCFNLLINSETRIPILQNISRPTVIFWFQRFFLALWETRPQDSTCRAVCCTLDQDTLVWLHFCIREDRRVMGNLEFQYKYFEKCLDTCSCARFCLQSESPLYPIYKYICFLALCCLINWKYYW